MNLDFLRHYRPQTNVVSRPTAGTGQRLFPDRAITKSCIPLLAAALIEGEFELVAGGHSTGSCRVAEVPGLTYNRKFVPE